MLANEQIRRMRGPQVGKGLIRDVCAHDATRAQRMDGSPDYGTGFHSPCLVAPTGKALPSGKIIYAQFD